MESDALWMIDGRGQEPGGCCISVSLHDYARFGEFILGGGKARGREVLPKGWIAAATHKQVGTGQPEHGYGYQWWTRDDGQVDAQGIFGQDIHIDPKRKLIVVVSSAWPSASGRARWEGLETFLNEVTAAVEAERAGSKN